jgi:hypothetical protein
MRRKTFLRPSSMATLKASAQNGAESSGGRLISSSVPGTTPFTGGTSSGEGR